MRSLLRIYRFFLFKHTAKKTCTMSLISSLSLLYLSLRQPSPLFSFFTQGCSLRLCVLTEFLLSIKSPSCSEIVERDEDNKKQRWKYSGTVRNKTIDILEHCKDWAHFFTWIYFFPSVLLFHLAHL